MSKNPLFQQECDRLLALGHKLKWGLYIFLISNEQSIAMTKKKEWIYDSNLKEVITNIFLIPKFVLSVKSLLGQMIVNDKVFSYPFRIPRLLSIVHDLDIIKDAHAKDISSIIIKYITIMYPSTTQNFVPGVRPQQKRVKSFIGNQQTLHKSAYMTGNAATLGNTFGGRLKRISRLFKEPIVLKEGDEEVVEENKEKEMNIPEVHPLIPPRNTSPDNGVRRHTVTGHMNTPASKSPFTDDDQNDISTLISSDENPAVSTATRRVSSEQTKDSPVLASTSQKTAWVVTLPSERTNSAFSSLLQEKASIENSLSLSELHTVLNWYEQKNSGILTIRSA